MGQDRRPRRRRRRARSGARRLPDGDVETPGRRLPAALPRRARSADRGHRRDRRSACPDPRSPAGASDGDRHRRRRPTATGSASSTIRRRSTATGSTATPPATTPTTPGGSGCSAARRSRPCAPTAGRSTSSTSTTGTPGPAAIFRDARYADDPIIGGAAILLTLHNLAYHGWTPRARLGQLGLRPGDGVVGDGRRRDRPAARRHRAGRARQHGLARVRGRGADARPSGWASTARCAPRATGSSGSSTGSTRPSGTRRPTPPSPRPTRATDLAGKAACRADLLARVGFDPADDGPVLGMIGRLDPQKGFDLLADAAPALLARGARLVVQGSGHPALADPFRALAAAHPRPGRAHRALRPGDGPADLRRRRPVR